MKFLIFVATVFSCTLAVEILDLKSLGIENLHFQVDKKLVNSFLEDYEDARVGAPSQIVAVIDDYADKILENIGTLSVAYGLDPILLDDVNDDFFLLSSITLNHGKINGISTIKRSGDVEVIYQSSNKLLELYVPIVFSNLNFTYDYRVIVLLIGPEGSFTGKIENFEMDLRLRFDFNTDLAQVVGVRTGNTGHVDLTFEGNGIIDLVVNILSEFVSTILHPLIVLVIEGIVTDVADTIVDDVNDFVDGVLHPVTEAVPQLILH